MTPAIMAVAFVAFAATGTLARAGAQGAARRAGMWPTGTLVVNLVGSFAVGLVAGAAGDDLSSPSTLALAATVGGLGAFTTFSSFAHELGILVEQRRWLIAGTYGATTLVAGAMLAWVGLNVTG